MFVCENPKFVYVSFTKSGSSSMYNLLETNFKGTNHPRHHKGIPPNNKSYPSFCVVRNPYSRLVSWWWSICKAKGDRYRHKKELKDRNLPESLQGFLTLWEEKNGTSQSAGYEHNNGIDHVLKLENIEEEFNALPFITKHIEIPKVNVKNHPKWSELLDTESGKMINRIYKRDFELFGYEMINYD